MNNLFGFNFYRNPYYSAVFSQKVMKPEWFSSRGLETIGQNVLKSMVLYADQECDVCWICAKLTSGKLMVLECVHYPEEYSPYDVKSLVSDRIIVNRLSSTLEQKNQNTDSEYQEAYEQLIEEGLIGQLASGAGREYKF